MANGRARRRSFSPIALRSTAGRTFALGIRQLASHMICAATQSLYAFRLALSVNSIPACNRARRTSLCFNTHRMGASYSHSPSSARTSTPCWTYSSNVLSTTSRKFTHDG
jgi:hypothetical protein